MSLLEAALAHDAPVPAAIFTGYPRFNFTGGHNLPEAIPTEAIADAAARAIRREGHKLATYNLDSGPLGHAGLRGFIAEKLDRQRGIAGTANDVLVTTGSLQALDLVFDLLLDPGDAVIMEQLTYAGTITRVRARGGVPVGVPLDGDGMRLDALEQRITGERAAGRKVKLIYTMPTIQNPTGSVTDVEHRRALLALAQRLDVVVVEDECYADLVWEGDWPPALRGLPGGEEVIHIGSFSKPIAPALRLGYVSAPMPILQRLVALKSDGGTPALSQMVVAELAPLFDEHVRRLKVALARKLEVLKETLAREFGTAAEITEPKGGIFLWVTLPEAVDTSRLAGPAAAAGIAFNPGAQWTTDADAARHSLRLCYAHPSEAAIREGVAELARICHLETGIPVRGANLQR